MVGDETRGPVLKVKVFGGKSQVIAAVELRGASCVGPGLAENEDVVEKDELTKQGSSTVHQADWWIVGEAMHPQGIRHDQAKNHG